MVVFLTKLETTTCLSRPPHTYAPIWGGRTPESLTPDVPATPSPKAPDETSQICAHGIFHILHSAHCQPVALRVVPGTLLNLDSHTCQLQRCRCGFLQGQDSRLIVRPDEDLCKPLLDTSFLSSAFAYSPAPLVGTMAAPIHRSRSHLLTKIGAPAVSCS